MPKLKPKHIIKFANLVGNKQQQIKLKIALTILALGISIGIAVEEFVGIGTWHTFQIQTDKVNICFTPPSGCGSLIAQQISQAKESIFVQAYSLTSSAIIHQLQQAHKRGVKVFVLLDGGNMSDNQDVFNQLKLAVLMLALIKCQE